MSDYVSNAEYHYISQANKCKKNVKPVNPDDPVNPDCGKHDYCKYCEYNCTSCYEYIPNVENDIRKFELKLIAKLNGEPFYDDCPSDCHKCDGRTDQCCNSDING